MTFENNSAPSEGVAPQAGENSTPSVEPQVASVPESSGHQEFSTDGATQESTPPVEQKTGIEANWSNYFENNPNPLAQPQYQPQQNYQQAQPAYQQPVYQQQPVQYPQQNYQQLAQPQLNANQQFSGLNPQEQQVVQNAVDLGISNEKALELIDENPVELFNTVAQKLQENFSQQYNPQNFQQQIQQQVNHQINNLVHQQQAAQLENYVENKVVSDLAKEQINLSQPQVEFIKNQITPEIDPAYQYYKQAHAQGLATGQLQGIPNINGQPLSKADFCVIYAKDRASKVFGNRTSQAAPNTVVRQTVNTVHSQGSPVVSQQIDNNAIKNMNEQQWDDYKRKNNLI